MKKSILTLMTISFLCFAGSICAQTTNVYWSFTGNAVSDNAATIVGLSTTFSSGNGTAFAFDNSSSSTGGSGYTTAAGYVASGGNNAAVADRGGAFDTGTNTYFSFSLALSALAGVSYQITDVSLGSRSTTTGPPRLSLYESVNGTSFTAALGTAGVSANSLWIPVDLSGVSVSLPDNGSTVYFRLYGTTATGSSSSANWRIDDLAVTLVATPEPSEIALATLSGIACLFILLRRR